MWARDVVMALQLYYIEVGILPKIRVTVDVILREKYFMTYFCQPIW